MGLYSLVCIIAKQLGQETVLKAEVTAWYPKDHVTFSDMLLAVRMANMEGKFNFREGKN